MRAITLCEARFFMRNQITLVIKNRMHLNAILAALLGAGFESMGHEYLHDGVHLHLKPPAAFK